MLSGLLAGGLGLLGPWRLSSPRWRGGRFAYDYSHSGGGREGARSDEVRDVNYANAALGDATARASVSVCVL